MKTLIRRTSSRVQKAEKPGYALRVSSGFNQGALVPLSRKKSILGRSFRACIPLEDDRVSREHAKIVFENGKFFLSDMGSTNGTFLNNEQVNSVKEVKPGDLIRIGNSIFCFETMKSENPAFHEKFKSATCVIPRAHFSFEDLSKIQPQKFRFIKKHLKPITRFVLRAVYNLVRELDIYLVKAELGTSKAFAKVQKNLSRIKLLK